MTSRRLPTKTDSSTPDLINSQILVLPSPDNRRVVATLTVSGLSCSERPVLQIDIGSSIAFARLDTDARAR
jgi:hypothetical protein